MITRRVTSAKYVNIVHPLLSKVHFYCHSSAPRPVVLCNGFVFAHIRLPTIGPFRSLACKRSGDHGMSDVGSPTQVIDAANLASLGLAAITRYCRHPTQPNLGKGFAKHEFARRMSRR